IEPAPDLGAVFAQAILNINLVVLIARERNRQPVQRAVIHGPLPFQLIQEIAASMRIAEEQPLPASGVGFLTFLHEGTERRDAGTGADHDDIAAGIRRQTETVIGVDEYGRAVALFQI